MEPAPHILSNPQQKWVVERSAHAIFSIRSSPRGLKFPKDRAAQQEYVALLDRASTEGEKRSWAWSKWQKAWSEWEKISATATGFVFEKPKGVFIILTSAHIIKESYMGSRPLTNGDTTRVNQAYFFDVCCIHTEREIQITGQEDNNARYVDAVVVAIDSSLDIMALQIREKDLADKCVEFHCTINGIADIMPPRGESLLLQGWPGRKCDTAVWGHMGTVRGYNWLTSENPGGYRMRVSEIPELDCEDGCSGGPLINGRLQCVSLYHGTLDYSGYAVHIADIKEFLINSGLVVVPAADANGHEDSKVEHEQAKDKSLQQAQKDNTNDDARRGRGRGKRNRHEEGTKRTRTGKMTAQEEDEKEDDWNMKKDKQRGRGRGGRRG